MNVKKAFLILLGTVCLILGTIGIVLPLLPTVPFYLATGFCYARSSQRLHDWFIKTSLYEKYMQPFVSKKGMTMKRKIHIITSVTLLMSIGFIMMRAVPAGQMVLGVIWIVHICWVLFGTGTLDPEGSSTGTAADETASVNAEKAVVFSIDPIDKLSMEE